MKHVITNFQQIYDDVFQKLVWVRVDYCVMDEELNVIEESINALPTTPYMEPFLLREITARDEVEITTEGEDIIKKLAYSLEGQEYKLYTWEYMPHITAMFKPKETSSLKSLFEDKYNLREVHLALTEQELDESIEGARLQSIKNVFLETVKKGTNPVNSDDSVNPKISENIWD